MESSRCDDGLSLSLSPPLPSTHLPSLPLLSPAIIERKSSLPQLTVGKSSSHDSGLSLSLFPPIPSTHPLSVPLVSSAITERKRALPKLAVGESSRQPACAVGPDMDACIEFVMLVKERLAPERYAAFLEVMISFKEKRIDFTTLESELMEGLFKGQPKLILSINKFFGKGNKFTNSEREATVHKFLDKLKDRDKVLYALFLTLQDDYLNSAETVSVSEFCQKVARIFRGHDDLFKEYESFLYDDSEKDPFQHASFGRNLSGVSLEERSLEMPMARRVYRGKVVVPSEDNKTEMKVGHEQRKQKRDGKEVDCDSNMEKQIKRMRVENHAKCSKNKELHCTFKKISFGSNNDLVSTQLTKESFVEGHLAREERVEGTDNKRRSKRLIKGCKTESKTMPDQSDKFAAKESGLCEASVLSNGEDQARTTISESDLSYSNSCSPSYRLLENCTMPVRTSVLNNVIKIASSSGGGGGGCSSRKQSTEDNLDDHRFELDVLMSFIEVAVGNTENLLKKINKNEIASNQEIKTSDHFAVLSLRCIEQLYGDHGEEMLKLLSKNVGKALPILRRRLDQKLEEAKNHSLKLNEYMKDMKSKLKSEKAG